MDRVGDTTVRPGTRPSRIPAAWLLASTPVVLLLTHYVSVLSHEFTHSVLAWILGVKDQPGNIDWGGTSFLNVLLLVHVDENVNYQTALAAGKNWQIALIAFAGAGLANAGLYLLSRRFITTSAVASRPAVAYVLFWFLLINLANLWDYVPIRVFASDGDVVHFRWATGISPWVIYAVVGYLVLWAVIDFYRVVLPVGLREFGFTSHVARATVLVVATTVLFGYFAIPGLLEPDIASQVVSRTSLLAIPVVIVLLWGRIVITPDPARPVPGVPDVGGPKTATAL